MAVRQLLREAVEDSFENEAETVKGEIYNMYVVCFEYLESWLKPSEEFKCFE